MMGAYKRPKHPLAAIALLLPALFVRVLVLQMLWNWFVASLGAPPVRYWHAFGLVIFLVVARGRKATTPDGLTVRNELAAVVTAISVDLCALGIGWLIYNYGMA